MRYRELYGFEYPDEARVFHADLGRGMDFYFCGVPRRWRLPHREYCAGMYFKNGVPMGYVEVMWTNGVMEVGFNLYYTFRQGETAWLYGRLLHVFQQQFGVDAFTIDPYQLGHENDEAIGVGRLLVLCQARISLAVESTFAIGWSAKSAASRIRATIVRPLEFCGSSPRRP